MSVHSLFHFLGFRYVGFMLQLVSTLLLAHQMGPSYWGVFSFLLLILQVLSYFNGGVNYSLNAIGSIKKHHTALLTKVWHYAFTYTTVVSLVLILVAIILYVLYPTLFSTYHFHDHLFILVLLSILYFFNILYLNLVRIYHQLAVINFYQIINSVLLLIVCFFYTSSDLFTYALWAMVIGNILSLSLFVFYAPLSIKWSFRFFKLGKLVVKKGFYLLLYNITFILHLLTARVVVSMFYTPVELGFFSLAVTLANAITLLNSTLVFALFPKLLHRLAQLKNNADKIAFLTQIRNPHMLLLLLLVFLSMVFIPYLSFFLPAYTAVIPLFQWLVLSLFFIYNTFGYTLLYMVNNQEKQLSFIGFAMVGIQLILSLCIVYFSMPMVWIAYSILFTAIGYNIWVVYQVNKNLHQFSSFYALLNYLFPIKKLFPFVLVILSIWLKDMWILPLFSLLLFVVFQYKEMGYLLKLGLSLRQNKTLLDF